jgi:hypothetical protein
VCRIGYQLSDRPGGNGKPRASLPLDPSTLGLGNGMFTMITPAHWSFAKAGMTRLHALDLRHLVSNDACQCRPNVTSLAGAIRDVADPAHGASQSTGNYGTALYRQPTKHVCKSYDA